jgi:hypothetical protein
VKSDKWLATLLMNASTLTAEMSKAYPYNQRKTYHARWDDEPENPENNEPEIITIYATDERMLLKFIDAEYTHRPDYLVQVITQYRPIKTS